MYKMRLIFQSYTVPELRVLARQHNKEVKIAGINKMKKPELIEAMMKHQDKFKKVQMKGKAVKKEEMTAEEKRKKKLENLKKKRNEKGKAKPVKSSKAEEDKDNIKKDLLSIMNKYYGSMVKLGNMVLNNKIIFESKEYEEIEKDNEENYDDALKDLFKKYKLQRDRESEFFESNNGYPIKIDGLIKRDKIPFKSLSNNKKLDSMWAKLDKKLEEDKKKKTLDTNKKEIFDIEGNILGFELANKYWKQFLKDFKAGKTKFGGKIKLGDYEEKKNELKKKLDDTRIFSSKIMKDLNNKSEFYKGLVKSFISERNKITRLYNKANTRFNNLTYLNDFESK